MKNSKVFLLLFAVSVFLSAPAFAQINAFTGQRGGGGGGGAVAGPDLRAVEKAIDAGSLSVGSTAQVVVVFRNEGTGDVLVKGINLYPSSNVSARVALNQCEREPVTPGAECAITVGVSGVQQGNWRVELLVEHTGRTRLATASVTGSNEVTDDASGLQSDLETQPAELDFGSFSTRAPQVRSVTLRNKTSLPIEISDLAISSPASAGFSLTDNCKSLGPGQGCVISVTWVPVNRGETNGVLTIRHSGDSAVAKVDLKGTYSPGTIANANIYPTAVSGKGLLVTDISSVDFGGAVDGAASITLSLVNDGDTALKILDISLAGSDNGLTLSRNGCAAEQVLDPVDACPLTVNWLPTRPGPIIDDIKIKHTGARGILVLPVRGTAVQPSSLSSAAGGMVQLENGEMVQQQDIAPVLDGYVVTSHSRYRAVIRGPRGSQVVSDGGNVVLAGVPWNVNVIDSGVRLYSDMDDVLLVFDRSIGTSGSGLPIGESARSVAASKDDEEEDN